jgi:hypothetical protein
MKPSEIKVGKTYIRGSERRKVVAIRRIPHNRLFEVEYSHCTNVYLTKRMHFARWAEREVK